MSARASRIVQHALVVLFLASLLLFARHATVHAQQMVTRQRVAQPDQLPREFVDLLLGRTMYSSGVPAYLVGSIGAAGGPSPGAEAFAAEGRVIGSAAWRDRSATAIAVAGDVEGARERFEALAQEAGWTPRPAPPERRGFVPARSEDPDRGFCFQPDDASLQIRAYRGPADSSYIVLEYRPGRGGFICNPSPDRRSMFDGLRAVLPTLQPPDGLQIRSAGGGGSGDTVESEATLFGAIAPAELIAHFEPQLREQGWTVGERLTGEAIAVLTADKPDDDGGSLELTVLVRRLTDEEHSLSMRVSRRR